MRKAVGMAALGALASGALAVWGGVSASGSATVDVGSGETKGPGAAVVSGEGLLVKRGAGTLALGSADLFRPGSLQVKVAEGGVTLSATAAPEPADLSAAVKAKLTLWLSAKSITSGEGELTRWHDVRETTPETPAYPYAEADTTYSDGAKPVYSATSAYVRGEVTNTQAAVSFRGYGSGVRMALKWPDGTAMGDNDGAKSFPCSAFAVYGHHDTTRFGNIFGSTHATEYPVLVEDFTRNSFFSSMVWGPLSGIVCRLDGNRIDGRFESVAAGFHMLEATPNVQTRAGWAIPYALMSRGKKSTSGGDLISEVMWFTQPITEDERLEVERYLALKWFGTVGTRRVALARDATLTVQTGAAGEVTRVPFAATGTGAVGLTGGGTLVIGTEANDLKDAAPIALKDGAIIANRSLPTLKVEAGTRLSATRDARGTRVAATADAAAGAVVKEGVGAARLAGLDADATRLDVKEGVLSLTPPVVTDPLDADITEVSIPGSGFESNDLADASYYNKGAFAVGNWGLKSWIGANVAFWYDYDSWTKVGGSASIGASIGAWGFNAVRPPEGTCAMAIKQGATLTTRQAFAIASPGTYEFSLMMWGRGSTAQGFAVKVDLLKADGSLAETWGLMRYDDASGFRQKVLTAQIASAGSYKLRLSGFYNYEAKCPDLTLVIDDLHLSRTGPLDTTTWKIPNGDFEFAKVPAWKQTAKSDYPAGIQAFSDTYTVDGWTFETPAGWTLAKPAVGVATPFTEVVGSRRGYNGFDNSRRPRGGYVGLLFQTNATVTTTFTPPAGTRYLAANIANWSIDCRNGIPLEATVTVGGETVSLGRVHTSSAELKRAVWPVPFTADGATAVTLAVTCVSGKFGTGAIADDFTLTTAYDETREIVTDGGFESNSTWTKVGLAGTIRSYLADLVNFGLDFAEGSRFLDYNGAGSMKQTVSFPVAGTYRLSMLVHNRKAGWVYEPIRAELVRGGVTNAILTVNDAPYRWTRYEAEFTVAEAGACELQLRSIYTPYGFVCVDDVSVRYFAGAETQKATFNEALQVRVAKKAMLVLDFEGEVPVDGVWLGGKKVFGRIDAATYPDYLSGRGAFFTKPHGGVIIIR